MKKKQRKVKKKGNFGKKKKKGESWKKKKRNALWITVVIHNALCVGEQ